MALEEVVSFLNDKRRKSHSPSVPQESVDAEREEVDSLRVKNAVYRKLLSRYAEEINTREEKTIPELKALVNPGDEAVQNVFKELTAGSEYSFENFPSYSEKVFDYCCSLKQIHAELGVSYWLSPSDIVELKAADSLDRSIFLCSLLHAGGCRNAAVCLIELEDGSKHPLVKYSLELKNYLMDPMSKQCLSSANAFDEALASFSVEGRKFKRVVYEFNDSEYSTRE